MQNAINSKGRLNMNNRLDKIDKVDKKDKADKVDKSDKPYYEQACVENCQILEYKGKCTLTPCEIPNQE